MKLFRTLFLLFALLLCGTAQAEVAVPDLAQRVTDLTATLDAGQVQALEARLAAFEKSKGSQIAVLMVPTTQPEEIEQFSIRVVEAWKLGRKGVDDGVLLLVAKEDRKLRIEVGYGLEGALNDATAKRIVAEVITPYFKRGEFYEGIDAGLAAIIKVVEGEALPAPEAGSADGIDPDSFEALLGAGLVIFIGGNSVLRDLLGRLPAGLLVGGAIGALVWFLFYSALMAGLAGALALILSLVMDKEHGGTFFSSGSGGGGGWGGGGGGFSGGGGGFGGGGASGGW